MDNSFKDLRTPGAPTDGSRQESASIGFGEVVKPVISAPGSTAANKPVGYAQSIASSPYPSSVAEVAEKPAEPVLPKAVAQPAVVIPPVAPSQVSLPVARPPVSQPIAETDTPPLSSALSDSPIKKPVRPQHHFNWQRPLRISGIVAAAILLLVGGGYVINSTFFNKKGTGNANVAGNFSNVHLPLDQVAGTEGISLLGTRSLVINGPLLANDGFTISPSGQPSNATPGQIYYDGGSNQLAYFNGSEFIPLGAAELTTGLGLATAGTQIFNTGVLSLQGQTGNVSLTEGPGIDITGTTVSNLGVISASSGSANIVVDDDGAGNITISSVGGGSGTVISPGGTAGRIAKFTGVQTIADSLISESGSTVTVNGDLSVTGNLTLGTALSVGNGGTGNTSLANDGVLVGQGSGAITAVTAGAPGLCLVSTAGAPAFGACTGGATVTSLNGLTGALTIANASGAGSTITINDASTTQKGIVQFNATNFTGTGTINTVQNINTGASPTFVGITLSGDLAVNGGDITSTGALNITPGGSLVVGVTTQNTTLRGATTSITSTGAGNDISLTSADQIILNAVTTIELQDATNVTGNFGATGTVTVGTFAAATSVAVCSNAGVLATCTSNPSGVTLQQAYDAGNTITTTDARDISFALANTATDSNFTITTATGSTGFTSVVRADGAGAADPAQLFLVRNNDTDRAQPIGISVQAAAGGITTAFDASGANITNALAIGAHAITGTNFSVTAGGAVTAVGVNAGTGLIQGTGGLTVSGATVSLNASSNFATNINTGTSTGTVTIGGGSAPLVIDSTNFDVTSAGAVSGVTTLSTSGNITDGGDLAVNGGDITSTGALNITPTGTLTAGSSGQTLTLQGNASTSLSATNAGSTTTLNFQTPTANVTYRLATAAAGTYDICTTVGNCAGAASTLQSAYDAGNTILTTDARDIAFTLANTATDSNFTITTATGSTGLTSIVRTDGAGTADPAELLLVKNNDTDRVLPLGVSVQSAGGGITTAFDASGANITNALAIGANAITGTNFNVTGSGAVTAVGVNSGTGLIQGTGGLTVSGAAISLNANSNFATNINTGTSTGTVTIGGGSAPLVIDSTNFDVTSAGAVSGVTTLSTSGNITDGGDIAVNGGDITSTGALNVTPIGTLTAGSTGQTLTLQGNASTTLSATNAGSTTTLSFQSPTANVTYRLATAAAGSYDICTTVGNCSAAAATLQSAYDAGNTILTTDARNIAFTLADTATDSNFAITVATGSTGFTSITRADGAGTADPAQLLLVRNNDVDRVLPIGVSVQSAGGGVTTAFDASGTNITNALAIGANAITGTNFNVTGAGAVTAVGVNSGTGLLQGTGGLTVSGATVSLNASSNFATNINTGTSTGTVTIGGGSAPLVINSTNFDVTSAGAVSGVTTLSTSSDITDGGDIAVNGGDITSTGALNVTPTGTLTAGSTGQTLTLQGNATTSLSATDSGSTTSLIFQTPTANVNYRLATATAGTYDICTTFGNCTGTAATLQSAYDAGNTILTTDGRDIAFTLANTTTDPNFTISTATGGTGFTSITRADGAGTADPAQLLLVKNNDTDRVQPLGISVQAAAGGITTAFDASGANITNALAIGSNAITGTNFSVTGAGNITSAGTYNTNTFTSTSLQFGGASTATIQSASSQALTITANAASTWSTSAGDLTLQAAGSLNLKAPGGNVVLGTTDGTGTLLVLDIKNTALDPAGTDGAIYYNSSMGSFRCYQGVWTSCITASGGFVSLQNAYNNGNTISTDATGDIGFTLNAENFTITTAAAATGSTTFSLADGSNATPPTQLVLITNNDTNQTLATGLKVTSATGGITTALDVSGANITNALAIGAHAITGTNFSVTGAGAVTAVGVNAGTGLLQGTGGATLSGATISLNASSNFATNINTGTSTGTITIGGGSSPLVIDSTNFDVTSAGAVSGVTTLSTSGGITDGGDLAVNGGDITSTGALNITPTGTLTAGSAGQTLTLQGNASTSLSATDSGNTTTLNFQVPTANVTYRLATAAAGTYDICTTIGNCSGSGSTNTLQAAYDAGNTILTTDARDIAFTLANTATDSNFTISTATGGTGFTSIVRADGAGTADPAQLVLVKNNDTDRALPVGVSVQSAGGGVTTAFDASGANITNALAIGANAVSGTNFSVTGAGAVTAVGVNSGTGLIQGTGGLTITGATVSLNASSNFATNINASTSTGTVTIGGGSSPLVIDSTNFDVTSAGAVSGVTTLSTSGIVTVGTLGANTGSSSICRNSSNQISTCSGSGGIDANVTLQNAYANGNTISTTDARDISLTLADTTTDANFAIGIATGSTSFASITRADGAGTADPAQLFLVRNADTDRLQPIGISVQSATGGITTAFDASGANIANALSIGANAIAGTNFSVTGAGAVTAVGVNAGTGLIQGTGGLTISGAIISLNSSSNFASNLNTGTSTGTITLGGGSAPLVIDSTNFDVTSAGAVSGVTTLSTSGTITDGGDLAVNGGDITSTGALNITPTGTLTAGSTGQALTLQGNASTTLTATDSGSTTSLIFQTPTANVNYRLATATAGTYDICTTFGNCTGTAATLQSAYDAGNTILTTDGRNIDFTLANTTTDPNFTITTATGSTGFTSILRADGAGTADPAQLLLVKNNDTDRVQPLGISVQSAGGGITTAFDASGSNITNALSIGSNAIAGTNFGVTGAGNVTVAGTYNTNAFTSTDLQFGGAATATLQSASSQALNITGNAASTWGTSTGDLTLQAAGGLNLKATTGNITLGTVDGTGTLLVLDIKNTATDPTGTNGAIYYNSSMNSFRCYQGAWTSCITASGGFVSLQNAYNNGNTISTDATGDIGFTLNAENFTITTAAAATGSTTFSLADGSNATPPSQLVLITNSDTNQALATGLKVTSATGIITTALDASGSNITNALSIGANAIAGTNFSVTGAGAVTAVGVNAGTGLLQGTGGATLSGATISLNNNSNFATNINTGTSTGTVTIGGGSAPLVIDSTNFDVTSAGAVSGVTTLNTSGVITVGALGANTGASSICRNSSNQISTCSGAGGIDSAVTLQNAYANGNTIATTDGRDISLTLTDTATDGNFTVTTATNSTGFTSFLRADGAGSADPAQLVLVKNNDIDRVQPIGVSVQAAAGGITTAFDASGANITNALAIGANAITGTNFSVTGAGAVTAVGVNAGAGLLQGAAGLTVSGATASINVSSNFATNINTGTSTGTITIGGGSSPLVIDSTNFDVTSAGALSGITTINNSGNITSGGDVAVNGGDITSTGALNITPGGTLTVGATGQILTLQGNASTTLSATNAGSTTTLSFQSPTANVTYRLATAAAGTYDVCTTVGNCSGAGSGNTLQAAYDAGNTIATTDARDIAFTLANTVTDSNFTITTATDSTGFTSIVRADGAGTNDPAQLLLVKNNDTDRVLPVGVSVQSAGGGVTTAFDASGANITNALAIGAHAITGTNFSVTGAGAVTAVGVNSGTGLIQGTGGLTITGATVSLNASSNFATNINTGTSTGTVTIGGGSAPLVIDSTNFDVTSAGAVSGVTTLSTSGNITDGGDIAVNGGDITSTGALNITPTGILTAGSTGQTLTLQGNASTTLSATDSGSTTTLGFEAPTANVTYRFRTAAVGTYDVCTTVGNCFGSGSGNTLQAAYDAGNAITTTDARDIAFTLANTTTDSNFTINTATGSTGFTSITRADGAGTADPAHLVLVKNNDTDRVLPIGISVQAAAGGVTTAFDASGANITNALAIGANAISGTNFSVTGAGAVTAVGVNSGTGLIQGTGGATLSGATMSLNASSNFATNINTGTSTGTVTIGGGSSPLVIDSTNFDVTSAGAVSGVTTLSTSGIITVGTLGANTGSSSICRNSSNQISTCSGSGGTDAAVTLQNAYANGNTIATTDARDVSLTLADTTTDGNFTVTTATGSTGFSSFLRADGVGTADPAQLVLIKNNDTDRVQPIGVSVQAATGGITTAFDASGANITNALAIGAHAITGTNFSVTGAGAVTAVGVNAGAGLLQGAAGLTVSGATAGINTSSNFATNINTGTSTGTVTIGGGSSPLVIDSTNFDVTSAGAVSGVTTLSTSGNITDGGDIAVNGGDITSTGALNITPTGTLTAGSTGQTLTLQGNANTSLSATDSGNTTSLIFQTPTANVNYRLATAAAGTYDICTTVGNCAGAATTLQSAYNAGNTILTTDGRDIAFTLADTTTDPNFTITTATGSTGLTSIVRADGAGTADPAELLLVKNNDTDRVLPIGVSVQSAGGGITTAFDASGANITNALAIGANAITGTNFSVTGAGAVTAVGVNSGTGLIQGTGGLSVSGATISLNASSNFATNINTGTSTGTVTIGGGSAPLVIDSTNFDVTSAGAVSGVTTLNTSGIITVGTLGANTGASSICRNSSNQISTCSGAGGTDAAVTLQNAYANGNTIATTDARDIAFTLANTTTDSNFTITTATDSTGFTSFLRADGAGTNDPAQLVLVKNNDIDRVQPIGVSVQAAAGGITTAFDASGANITNALAIGAHAITGTNFSVTGAGAVTAVGVNAGAGLLQGAAGLTVSGATASINTSSNFATNINTGTSTGTVTIGGGSSPLVIDSTNFDVTSAGAVSGVTTLSTSGNITDGGDIAVNGGDITSTGALNITPTGTLTAGSTGRTLTLQGNASTTLSATDTGNTTTLSFQVPTANVTYRLATAAAGTYDVCTTVGNCSGTGSTNTLQAAYDAGNTILTTDGRDIAFTLANTTTDPNFTINTATGSTGFTSITRADGAGTADPAQLLLVKNNDTDRVLPIGISVQSAGGGVTTAFDASGANITNALAVGANAISGTNFSVTGAGAVTAVGVNSGTGLIQGTGGLTVSGATVSLNASSNFATNINTGTSTGTVTIGGGSAPLVIDSTNFDVTSAGAVSGVTTLSTSGIVTVGTLGANTGSSSICRNSSNQISTCSGSGGIDAAVTLQNAYANGNSISTTDARDVSLTLADTTTDGNFTITTATNSTGFTSFLRADGGGTADPAQLVLVKNNDTDRVQPLGISVQSAAGGITTAFDASGANITNALAIGAHAITGTNFSVTGAGAVTAVGVNAGAGLLQGALGLTVTGAAVSLNASSNFATNINTGTSTGTVTIGGGSAPLVIDSTNFDVTSAGAVSGVTTLSTSGNITDGGDIAVNGGDITSTGALNITPTGALTAGSAGQTLTLQGNASTSLSATDSGSTTSLVFQTPTANVNYRLATAAAGTYDICTSIGNCSGAATTLQTAYDAGNTILTTDGRDIGFTLANTTTDPNLTINTVTGGTGFTSITRADGAGTADPAQLLLVKNNDTDRVLPIGVSVQSAGGGVTTAFDASGANITNALAIGANAITGTNFSVTGAGAVTAVGVNSGTGLIQGTGGLTISGATISLNASSNFATNINTGTSTGTVTIGGGSAPLVIDSTNFDVTSAGALSGITTISTSSTINSQTISSTANFTGTVTIQGANALTLGVTSTSTGAVLFKGSTAASGTLTLIGQANPTTNTITLPNETGTICTSAASSPANCTNFAPATGSTVYATKALDNLLSVNINTALSFQNNQTATINFASAASAGGNALNITGQTAGGTANNGGAITIQAGTATTTGTGGLLTLSGGLPTATGVDGSVSLDTGHVFGATAGTIDIGNGAWGHTVNIATSGAALQTIAIGSNGNSGDTVTIEGGTSGYTIFIGNGNSDHGIKIGTGTGTQTVIVGSTSGSSGSAMQGGTGGVSLTTGGSLVANTGAINLTTGDQNGTSLNSGSITIRTGDNGGTDNSSGSINLQTGFKSGTGVVGAINLNTTNNGAINTGTGLMTVGGALTVNGVGTFNTDVDFTLAGTENVAVTHDLAGTINVFAITGTPNASANTANGLYIDQVNSANTNGFDSAIVINNSDTNLVIGNGILFSSSGGGFTNFIDTPSSVFKVDGSGNTTVADLICSSASCISTGEITDGTITGDDVNSNIAGLGLVKNTATTPDSLDVDLLGSQDGSGSTFSFSGLEFQGASSDTLTLLQGCSDNQILKWDDETGGNGRWDCAADNGGSMIVRESDGSPSVSSVSTLEFGPASTSSEEFIVTDQTGGVARVVIGTMVGKLNEAESVTGGWTFGTGATVFNSLATFNTDVDMIFGGTENLAVTSDLAGTVNVASIIGTPSASAGTTAGLFIQQAASANTNGIDSGIVIDNADTDLALATAIEITNTGAFATGITKGIDFNATGIVTDIELQNGEQVDNNTDDLITLTGTGGTNNETLVIDLDSVGASGVTLSSGGTHVLVNDNLSVGIDGATTENISYAGFAFSGNDLYTDDMLGVNGNAFIDGTLSVLGTSTFDGLATFNTDVDMTFAGTENQAITSDLAGTVNVLSIIGTPSASAGTTRGIFIQQAASASTNGIDSGIVIDNADTDLALATAIEITNSGAFATGITKGIDFNTTGIVTDIELQNAEQIDNNTDDNVTFTGTGGTNNETFTIDLDSVGSSGATLSSGGTFVLVNDNLSVGIDGATTENISTAGFAFSGNDLYVDDMFGVNGNTFLDGTVNFGAMITDANAVLYTDTNGLVTRVVETETGSQCLLSGAGASGIPVWGSCAGGSSPFTSDGTTITKTTIGDVLSLRYGDAADTQLTIENTTNNVIPTSDAAVIDLSGNTTGIITDGVDGLYIHTEFGDEGSTTTTSALHLDVDPVAITTSGDNFYALNIDGLSATSATEYAINIGSNWDQAIVANGKVSIGSSVGTSQLYVLGASGLGATDGLIVRGGDATGDTAQGGEGLKATGGDGADIGAGITPGLGGIIELIGGIGGAGDLTNDAAAGGGISITGGAGGNAAGANAGNGGNVVITGGASGTGGSATAGSVIISGGTGTGTGQGVVIVRPNSDASNIFQVQTNGTTAIFTADTETAVDPLKIKIGDTSTANAPVLLVLDQEDADPTGVTGAMYFQTGSNTFRCYTTSWGACAGSGSAPRLDQITAATTNGSAQNSANFTIEWDWNSLTTQRGLTMNSTATGLTTGGLLALGSTSSTYNHANGETGSLFTLGVKDGTTTSGAVTSTTNALSISATLAATTSTSGVKTLNAINANAPTFTSCSGGGTCVYNAFLGTLTAPAAGITTVNGINIVGAANTVAATTQSLIFLDPAASGNSNGTLVGLNIDSITTGGVATEYGINVGSGWDQAIVADGKVSIGSTIGTAQLRVTGANGSSSAGTDGIVVVSGNGSGASSFDGGANTITSGTGASNSSGATTAGKGGLITLTTGTGGATSGTSTAGGGAGGALSLIAGNGGAGSTSASLPGGTGGSIIITAGNGGDTNGTAAQGNGGSITLTAGAAGTIVDTPGVSGNINFLTASTGQGSAGSVIAKSGIDSDTFFQIQRNSGVAILTADTESTNNPLKIQIGDTSTANAPVMLVLDQEDADPSTGLLNGMMYYNTTTNKFKCYENTGWTNCIGSGGSTTLQQAYDADADGSEVIISLTAADDGLIFRNPLTTGTNLSAYILTIDQLETSGTGCAGSPGCGGLLIQSVGTGPLLKITDNTSVARDVLTIADGGATTFRNQSDSTAAFKIMTAAGTDVFNVDTSNSKFILGTSTNGMVFDTDAGTGPTYVGTGRPTKRITLVPEYPGAVLSGDSDGSNTGTMTSDFCSNSALLNINSAAACATSGDQHNYYTWVTTSGNDYDIYITYRMPSDFDGFTSSTSIQMYAWRTDSTATTEVKLALFEGATECGTGSTTNIATGTATWTENPPGGDESACSGIVANDIVTWRINMEANNKTVRAGEIRFDYYSKF